MYESLEHLQQEVVVIENLTILELDYTSTDSDSSSSTIATIYTGYQQDLNDYQLEYNEQNKGNGVFRFIKKLFCMR